MRKTDGFFPDTRSTAVVPRETNCGLVTRREPKETNCGLVTSRTVR